LLAADSETNRALALFSLRLQPAGHTGPFEAPAIIGTCINCVAPGSLGATLALIVIGAGIALTTQRRKLALVRSGK
jgi:hypothetical protein